MENPVFLVLCVCVDVVRLSLGEGANFYLSWGLKMFSLCVCVEEAVCGLSRL